MQSRWKDSEAQEFVTRYAAVGRDIALRTYTSRLIGADDDLVLHGGGNTSVKTKVRDVLGRDLDVVCVKGSGWDLATIEPAGLPACDMAPLLALRKLAKLSDEEMVNQLRGRLLDSNAPTPSVETLLHAFLPAKFVDHTHADAICVLTNQPNGAQLVREALGPKVLVLPWIMPGFPLAIAVADAFDKVPDCEGIALLHHGLFTFGDDARTSYERMIEQVDRAERFIAARTSGKALATVPARPIDRAALEADVARIAPIVRGALATKAATPWGEQQRRLVVDWRGADDLVAFASHTSARALCQQGPLTPDHVIRTKCTYLHLSREFASDGARCRAAVNEYTNAYKAYFEANKARVDFPAKMLAPEPVVAVIEGLGLLAFGPTKKAAAIAADIAEHTLRGKARGAALGKYVDLSPGELFEMEYWSLEQKKLGKQSHPVLAGQVALVTGAAGAIGAGIAEALLASGAHVFLTDVDAARLEVVRARLAKTFGKASLASATADVTKEGDVNALFAACCRAFGGVDVLVPNAGIAYVSKLEQMDVARFQKVVDVNLLGTLLVLKEGAKLFRAQGTGGSVVVQASKNVFAPGASFGAYSASKAGASQLARIAALEFAELGVRVNTINADAVFGDDEVPSGLWELVGPERMKSRGLDPQGLRDYYRERSLLKVPVLPRHVGEAVVFFASGLTPTTGATLPVDGGLPEAFPR
jgi:rhamnulose-1-phosphate aldolase/alcohol dehydrogenase